MNLACQSWRHPKMSVAAVRIAACIAAAATLGGCGKSAPAPAANLPDPNQYTGVITGIVKFTGTAPAQAPIPIGQCCIGGPTTLPSEAMVANSNGTLKNVIVYLKDAPPVGGDPGPPVTLDQHFCQYVPHVVALRVGQTLHISSTDVTMHNVDLKCNVNPPDNFSLIGPVAYHDKTFSQPEIFNVKCDIHPWMSAWVGVFASPYFAVTGDDGRFRIEHVPPGAYTLEAWQESLPPIDQTITVGPQPVDTTITFPMP